MTYEFPEWVLFEDYFYYSKDIVSFGDELTVENLKNAYRLGIFPWHIEGLPLPWYCPEKRAVLDFSELHIPKSLERARRKNPYTFTIDKAFETVIGKCSTIRRAGQNGTWITPDFELRYRELHDEGFAHSVEAWDPDDELVGGVYGVDAGGVFCGESMFHTADNASKLALLFMIDYLRDRGAGWIDAQVMTPHIKALGAKEIRRKEFLRKLKDTQALSLDLFGVKVELPSTQVK
ncbi:MAG TPA: leucyl/phenylalanyl-tRNA--protein transferase [Pyrinomonadaceae bacterium]|nr:leucyl/phenylalanyl-tRNA--protein transferase [Pyrinomonadaceae bacterium]